MGSSCAAGEILCAFLLAQLEDAERLTRERRACVSLYREFLAPLEERGLLRFPVTPDRCRGNGHAFFVRAQTRTTRDALMDHLRSEGIGAVFHYVPLHSSPMGQKVARSHGTLLVTDAAAEQLLRLPLFPGLEEEDLARVADEVGRFFGL